jgi:hypothetical protein
MNNVKAAPPAGNTGSDSLYYTLVGPSSEPLHAVILTSRPDSRPRSSMRRANPAPAAM